MLFHFYFCCNAWPLSSVNLSEPPLPFAGALTETFSVSVKELPLSLIISRYGQKAGCVLLALLHSDLNNIRLGHSLPAFLTPKLFEQPCRNMVGIRSGIFMFEFI